MLFRLGITYCSYFVFKMEKLIKIEKTHKSRNSTPPNILLKVIILKAFPRHALLMNTYHMCTSIYISNNEKTRLWNFRSLRYTLLKWYRPTNQYIKPRSISISLSIICFKLHVFCSCWISFKILLLTEVHAVVYIVSAWRIETCV